MNLTAVYTLSTDYSCGQCKKKFDKPWLVPTGKPFPQNLKPNVEIMFHWEETHGFPHEIFIDEIKKLINSKEDPVGEYLQSKGNTLREAKNATE